jgi:hypothetical protein
LDLCFAEIARIFEVQALKVEEQTRERWEMMRIQTGLIVNAQTKVDIKKLIPLPWDSEDPDFENLYVPTETDWETWDKW